jgi:hypothetical protein
MAREGRASKGWLDMFNIHGKAYAMNTISPMKPWRSVILRLFFFIWRHYKPFGDGLKELSFIHFARWVIVPRRAFPRIGERQPGEDLRYDYLFFFSNFNGTWNQYIDAFSAVLNRGLNLIWRWSEKFPGSVPVTPFKNFIVRGQIETDYYYTAYPHATTNDVKAAHRVQAALDNFAHRSDGMSPEQFGAAYRQFLVQVQGDLGETGQAPVGT